MYTTEAYVYTYVYRHMKNIHYPYFYYPHENRDNEYLDCNKIYGIESFGIYSIYTYWEYSNISWFQCREQRPNTKWMSGPSFCWASLLTSMQNSKSLSPLHWTKAFTSRAPLLANGGTSSFQRGLQMRDGGRVSKEWGRMRFHAIWEYPVSISKCKDI